MTSRAPRQCNTILQMPEALTTWDLCIVAFILCCGWMAERDGKLPSRGYTGSALCRAFFVVWLCSLSLPSCPLCWHCWFELL